MFLTQPQAEMQMPNFFGDGEKMWSWIKLGVNAPYFLIKLVLTESDGKNVSSINEHFWLNDLSQILDLQNQENDSMRIVSVSMLIPGYMRNTDDYTMGRIKEIWGCKKTRIFRYVMEDGETLHLHQTKSKSNLELLFQLKPLFPAD